MKGKSAVRRARRAMVDYFDDAYGKDVARIEAWQDLCREIGAEEGTTIMQCKEHLKGIYVNIVDFPAGNGERESDSEVDAYQSRLKTAVRHARILVLKWRVWMWEVSVVDAMKNSGSMHAMDH